MHHAINAQQLRLDVQRFLWPVNYIALYYIILFIYAGPLFASWGVIYMDPLSCILGCNITWILEVASWGVILTHIVSNIYIHTRFSSSQKTTELHITVDSHYSEPFLI